MYFLDTKALAKDLKTGTLSQREAMKYLIATLVVFLGYFGEWSKEYLTITTNSLTMLILVIGVIMCYNANSQGDDKNFVERFICLSWPLGIRVGLVIMLIIEVFTISSIALSLDTDLRKVIFVFLATVGSVFYTYLMRSYFLYVSGAQDQARADGMIRL